MSIGTILLIVLILVAIGILPVWPYANSWGPYPAGGVGVLIVVILVLIFAGVIR